MQLPQIYPQGVFGVPFAPQVPTRNFAATAASSGLAEVVDKLGQIGEGIRQDKINNQLAAIDPEYRGGLAQTNLQLMQDPKFLAMDPASPEALTYVKAAYDKYANSVAAKYPDIVPIVWRSLKIHQGDQMVKTMTDLAYHQDQQQRAQLTGPIMDATVHEILAAQNRGDVNEAGRLTRDYYTSIDKARALTSEEKQAHQQIFNSAIAVGSMQSAIASNPANATLQLNDPDFIKNYPDISPEAHQRLLGQADEAMRRPLQQIEVGWAAKRAGLFTQFAQQPPSADQLDQAIKGGWMTVSEARHFRPGFKDTSDDTSDPHAAAGVQRMIDADPEGTTSFDVATYPGLSKGDRRLAINYLQKRRAETRGPDAAAQRMAEDYVTANLVPSGADDMYGKNVELKNSVLDSWRAFSSTSKSAADRIKAAKEFVQIYNPADTMGPAAPGERAGILRQEFRAGRLGPPAPIRFPGESPGSFAQRIRAYRNFAAPYLGAPNGR